MKTPAVVSPQEWRNARDKLLVKEKELFRARDALAAERRRMPWMAVDKDYSFDGPNGRVSLDDIFEGRMAFALFALPEELDMRSARDDWKHIGS